MSQGITIILIVLHIWIPKLRKHPGQYVFIQCLCQFIYDIHWVLAFSSFSIPNQVCTYIGIIENLSINIGLTYIIALSLELLIKFKDISNIAYYKRNLFYHFFSIFTAIVMFVLIFTLGSFGQSPLGTCALQGQTSLILQNSLRALTFVILFGILATLLQSAQKLYSRIVLNYCLVIVFVWITWCLPGFITLADMIFGCENCKIIAIMLGTLSGTFVGLSRFVDTRIFREVKKKFSSRNKKLEFYAKNAFYRQTGSSFASFKESLLNGESIIGIGSSINCYSDLFKSLLNKSKLEILGALYVFFSQFAIESQDESAKNKTRGFVFQPSDFQCLEPFLKSSEYEYRKSYLVLTSGTVLLEFRNSCFYHIRSLLGYQNSDFLSSISDQLKSSYTQARVIQNEATNSMLIFTNDNKFVIKTISKQERKVFFQFLLESYCKRIMDCADSKLIRILGISKLLPSKITFIVMEHSSPYREPSLVFDLKGSSIDRLVQTKGDLKETVLKDENLKKLGKKIKLSSDEATSLLWTLKEDMRILRDIGIMDYSLLLIACKNRGVGNRYAVGKDYSLAIIDLFQIYDSRKVIERWFKVCCRRVDKRELSSVSPAEYFRRILAFVEELFTERDEYDLSGMLE